LGEIKPPHALNAAPAEGTDADRRAASETATTPATTPAVPPARSPAKPPGSTMPFVEATAWTDQSSTPGPYGPATAPPGSDTFYADALGELETLGLPYLVSGTFAVNAYTGLNRPTKDMDVFCRPGDYPAILAHFQRRGYEAAIKDERWLAKVWSGDHFFDLIFCCTVVISPITDAWFIERHTAEIYGRVVPIIAPTELVWSKSFVQSRERYDGADVAHVILCQHDKIDWKRLLSHMDAWWEVLLMHVLNFRFIYPSERDRIPAWLFDELLDRLRTRAELPVPQTRVCRGRLFSRTDYLIDVTEWGYADILGQGERRG